MPTHLSIWQSLFAWVLLLTALLFPILGLFSAVILLNKLAITPHPTGFRRWTIVALVLQAIEIVWLMALILFFA